MNGDPPIDNANGQDEQEFLQRQGADKTQASESPICDYPGCAISDPHYHRETPDGEEIVRAHVPGMKPIGLTPLFAAPGSLAEQNAQFQLSLDAFVNAGGAAINVAVAAELIARRIAIDMLASKEFSDRIHIAQKAFIFELTKTQEFKSAVGEIASNMIGQNTPVLLESDEFKDVIEEKIGEIFDDTFSRRTFGLLGSLGFRLKVMDIAWPKVDTDGIRKRTLSAIFSTMQRSLFNSDEFEQIIHVIVDERMTSKFRETMKAIDDEEAALKRAAPAAKAILDACDPTDVP